MVVWIAGGNGGGGGVVLVLMLRGFGGSSYTWMLYLYTYSYNTSAAIECPQPGTIYSPLFTAPASFRNNCQHSRLY